MDQSNVSFFTIDVGAPQIILVWRANDSIGEKRYYVHFFICAAVVVLREIRHLMIA